MFIAKLFKNLQNLKPQKPIRLKTKKNKKRFLKKTRFFPALVSFSATMSFCIALY